jgi:hypothetical protein
MYSAGGREARGVVSRQRIVVSDQSPAPFKSADAGV